MTSRFYAPTEDLLELDGSVGEGGGQILRTSLSLSALTGRPFRLVKIRAGRSRPGLRPQHLTAVRAAAAICQADLVGDEIDSQTLTFRPTRPAANGRYIFDVTEAAPRGRSAGAVTLILQTVLWPLLFATEPCRVALRGGTHVNYSPSFHYIQHVARPSFERYGASFHVELIEFGWMPDGGGQITLETQPVSTLHGVSFDRSEEVVVEGQAIVTNLAGHIPHRMARRADNLLEEANIPYKIEARRLKGQSAGAGLFLWTADGQAGAGGLGKRGVAAQDVAADAVDDILTFAKGIGAVDEHLADQLLLPAALANGTTRYSTNRLTEHTLTNIELIQKWLPVQISVSGILDQPGEIVVTPSG